MGFGCSFRSSLRSDFSKPHPAFQNRPAQVSSKGTHNEKSGRIVAVGTGTMVKFYFSLTALGLFAFLVMAKQTKKKMKITVEDVTGYNSEDYALFGYIFKTYTNTRLISQCARHCERLEKCESFNYLADDRTCTLNNQSDLTYPSALQPMSGSVYLRKTAIIIKRVSRFTYKI